MSKAWPVRDVDAEASVEVNARRVLAVRVAEFYSYDVVVQHPELQEALHDLRIAAKRLRYTLELFRPQLGQTGGQQIDRIKTIQEALGTLHDHDVRIALIGDELSRIMLEQSGQIQEVIAAAPTDEIAAIATAALRPAPDDPRRGLIALLGREHAARRAAYDEFRARWEDFARAGMRADLVRLSAGPVGVAELPGEVAA